MTVSLLIRLQAVLLRTSTDAALRWASEPEFFQYVCRYVPPFSCVFLRCLPAMSSFSQRCPQVSLVFPSLPFIFSSIVMVFSTFSSIFLHLQLFATSSSASLLIPLQTVWLRTPTDAALRWASDPWFFEYACLYVPSFFKALSCLHCMTFF